MENHVSCRTEGCHSSIFYVYMELAYSKTTKKRIGIRYIARCAKCGAKMFQNLDSNKLT